MSKQIFLFVLCFMFSTAKANARVVLLNVNTHKIHQYYDEDAGKCKKNCTKLSSKKVYDRKDMIIEAYFAKYAVDKLRISWLKNSSSLWGYEWFDNKTK